MRTRIHPSILAQSTGVSASAKIKTLKIIQGSVLPEVFKLTDVDYEKIYLTQHQVLDCVLDNWDVIRYKVNSLYFVTKIKDIGYCLFCFIVSDQKNKLLIGILPIEDANSEIKDSTAMLVISQ